MNRKQKNTLRRLTGVLLALFLLAGTTVYTAFSAEAAKSKTSTTTPKKTTTTSSAVQASDAANENAAELLLSIPAYSGEPYVVVNDNVPYFTQEDLTTTSFETYSSLDSLGRCSIAYACIGTDLMPTGDRESISSVTPTGWQSVTYDIVDGKYLYNRCHLIGYQLTAENANELNLITGTRYLNVEGMLPFENMVADYVEETENHVLYRVTPIFEGDNLVASGVLMEAMSVEDEGEEILFCVYCYNVQPGIAIDYANGESELAEETTTSSTSKTETASGTTSSSSSKTTSASSTKAAAEDTTEDMVWIPTNGGTKYHKNSTCSNMEDPSLVTLSEAKAQGYTACKKCYK